jgi:DNA-binding response OmpR family regulator
MVDVLLVEDTLDLAQVVRRELENAGFQVTLALDGADALVLFKTRPFKLVILDWMLPKLDGMEVLRRLREESSVPVLMLTARGEVTDRVFGLEGGADDYLVKPFSLQEMVARVHALLRREERFRGMMEADQSQSVAVVQWQGLELNPFTYQASLDGQPLELTPTEFELLCLLMRSPGRTFNRLYLIETVWRQLYVEGDRSIDNAVMRLRKKLGSLGDGLETVRGIGYRLRLEK